MAHTVTLTASGRMPGNIGSSAASVASSVVLINSGVIALAPMLASNFTCVYISCLGADKSTTGGVANTTGPRGMIGVTRRPHGTIAFASAGVNYHRYCAVDIERVDGVGSSSTLTLTRPYGTL